METLGTKFGADISQPPLKLPHSISFSMLMFAVHKNLTFIKLLL